MEHGICARGIAAASLALAANSASAAKPVDPYDHGMPSVRSLAPGAASPNGESIVTTLPTVTAPDMPSRFARHEPKATIDASADPSLDELVGDHAARAAPDAESECLAGAVYFEARGEPIEGQLAVAEVVLNRAASGEYPTSICDVVKQPAQFSFVRNGLFPPFDASSPAWRRAVGVAHVAAQKLADELSSDVLWYHADYVAPAWGRRLSRATQIGAHIFYRRA